MDRCRVCGHEAEEMWGEICNNCRKSENLDGS